MSAQRPDPLRRARMARLTLVAFSLVAFATIGISSLAAGVSALRPVTGTSKADVLRGSARADQIRGYGGNDRLFGYRGNDVLLGGVGADVVVGGLGTDRLYGGPGNDRLNSRDGVRDYLYCGAGRDTVIRDARDAVSRDCEAGTAPPAPGPPPPPSPAPAPRPGHTVILENQPWNCRGRVDLDLVRVTMRSNTADAIQLDQDCNGRVGRLEVETWTADGIKIQNRGQVAHDFVIESGYVKCHDVAGGYHQDGVQAMGGLRITMRNLSVDCLRNSNFFMARGGSGASTPTEIVCDGCTFGPHSGQTVFVTTSIRSGVRNSTICEGRFTALRIDPQASSPVNVGNRILPRNHPSCANVTGR
ncbi:MAG: calcium-binding protein [Gaiellaceae bacterium]